MPQLIPTQPDDPNYSISVTLDGIDYVMTFRYSGRENCFYLDLALTDGTALVRGRKVVCNWPLFRDFRYNPQVPQGALVAIPSGSDDSPAGILDDGTGELGDGRRVVLLYLSPSELAA